MGTSRQLIHSLLILAQKVFGFSLTRQTHLKFWKHDRKSWWLPGQVGKTLQTDFWTCHPWGNLFWRLHTSGQAPDPWSLCDSAAIFCPLPWALGSGTLTSWRKLINGLNSQSLINFWSNHQIFYLDLGLIFNNFRQILIWLVLFNLFPFILRYFNFYKYFTSVFSNNSTQTAQCYDWLN